jgi:hypothetical protein
VDYAYIVGALLSGQVDLLGALRQIRLAVQKCDGERHAKIAEQAVTQILVEVSQGESISKDISTEIAERFLMKLVDHALVGRLRPRLVGNRYTHHRAALAHEDGYKSALECYVKKIASDLVRDPAARGLRAPLVRIGVKPGTGALMGLSLSDWGRRENG